MAHIANTRKVFNFAIEIGGLNQFLVQKVTPPELGTDVTEHGDSNYNVKTPGRRTTGEAVLEKIVPEPGADNWAWDWFNSGQDPFTGGGALAGNVKRLVVVRELGADGVTVLRSWAWEGCFVSKYNTNPYDRMSSDNIIETVTIQVDRVRRI